MASPTEPISEADRILLDKNLQLVAENGEIIAANRKLDALVFSRERDLDDAINELFEKESAHQKLLEAAARLKEKAKHLLCSNDEKLSKIENLQLENCQLKGKIQRQQAMLDSFENGESRVKPKAKEPEPESKMPTNKVRRENFELKRKLSILETKNSVLSKELESQRDIICRFQNPQNEVEPEDYQVIAKLKRQIQDLKDEVISQREAQVKFLSECNTKDYVYQRNRDQRFKKFYVTLFSKSGFETDDESESDEQQEREINKDSVLKGVARVNSPPKEAPAAGDAKAAGIVKSKTSASVPASVRESVHPIVTRKTVDASGNSKPQRPKRNKKTDWKASNLLSAIKKKISCGDTKADVIEKTEVPVSLPASVPDQSSCPTVIRKTEDAYGVDKQQRTERKRETDLKATPQFSSATRKDSFVDSKADVIVKTDAPSSLQASVSDPSSRPTVIRRTDGRSNDDKQQITERNEEADLKATSQLSATTNKISFADNKADAIVKTDVPASLPASVPDQSSRPTVIRKTEDAYGVDKQKRTERKKETDLEATPQFTAATQKDSFMDSKADVIVKGDVSASTPASLPEPSISVANRHSLEKLDSKNAKVDTRKTDVQEVEECTEFICSVCKAEFKTKKSLENHLTYTKCRKSIKPEDTTAAAAMKQAQPSSSSASAAVDTKTKEPVIPDTSELLSHAAPTPSPKKKSAKSKQPVSNHRKDDFRSRTERGYYCMCGKQFPSRTLLESHIDNQQSELGTVKCKYCGMKFDNTIQFSEHLFKAHSGKLENITFYE